MNDKFFIKIEDWAQVFCSPHGKQKYCDDPWQVCNIFHLYSRNVDPMYYRLQPSDHHTGAISVENFSIILRIKTAHVT